jgi:glycosyltransferase involved in cell wall biosynthesis
LLGRIAETDLPALYSGAKVFILPSLSEGFGLTALEAMACGTPVVASAAGALPETVGQAGSLVDPDDPDALADAILQLMSDKGCWQEYRRRGLEHVQHFSWQKTADRVRRELEIVAREG